SPALSGLSATLWPIGMSCSALSVRVVSVSVMRPSISVPRCRPSTTTTPTLSLGLWTRKCGAGTLFPLVRRSDVRAASRCGWRSYIRSRPDGRRSGRQVPAEGAMAEDEDPRPLYARVRERLLERIRSGAWKPGQLIPNEFAIAAEFGVSQGTARKAISSLAAERLLRRRHGRGTFVVEHTPADVLFRFFNMFDATGSPL